MSQFEFVQITFAIILGLGVTTIVASIGDQVRLKHVQSLSALHIYSQGLLLYSLLVWLWGFWAARNIDWSVSIFIYHALSPVFLALAAHVSKIEISSTGESAEDQYFRNHRTFYGFWSFASLVGISQTFYYVSIGELDPSYATPLNILRFAALVALVAMAISRNRMLHWIALTVIAVILSSVLLAFFFSLDG